MSSRLEKYANILKVAGLVPLVRNKLSELEFARVLRKGYKLAFGKDPTLEVLAGGWAQGIHESGRPGGIITLPNNNVGNVKAFRGWINSGGDYFVRDAFEYDKNGKKFTVKNDKWRSYPTPEAGAAGYWKLLGNDKYKRSLDWMAAGDSASASVVLGVNGYYTSSIKAYAKRTSNLNAEFIKRFTDDFPDLESDLRLPPGDKLPLKTLAQEYTKEERDAIDKKPDETNNQLDREVEELKDRLMANNSLSKIVKNSILKKKLPTSKVLVYVAGNNYCNKLEYSRVLSRVLKIIDADALVCGDGNDVEIQCSAVGNEMTVIGAIQELCDHTLNGMNKYVDSGLSVIVLSGLISIHDIVEHSVLISNSRLFNLGRILNG